jgi:ribonuclease inhibitor
MKKITINGAEIHTAKDVHALLAVELDFGRYYGKNFDALWDMLKTGERPLHIIWENASISRQRMLYDFNNFISLFSDLVSYDKEHGFKDAFSFSVED